MPRPSARSVCRNRCASRRQYLQISPRLLVRQPCSTHRSTNLGECPRKPRLFHRLSRLTHRRFRPRHAAGRCIGEHWPAVPAHLAVPRCLPRLRSVIWRSVTRLAMSKQRAGSRSARKHSWQIVIRPMPLLTTVQRRLRRAPRRRPCVWRARLDRHPHRVAAISNAKTPSACTKDTAAVRTPLSRRSRHRSCHRGYHASSRRITKCRRLSRRQMRNKRHPSHRRRVHTRHPLHPNSAPTNTRR